MPTDSTEAAARSARITPTELLTRIAAHRSSAKSDRFAVLVVRLNRSDRLAALSQHASARQVLSEVARRVNSMLRAGDCYSFVSTDELWMLADRLVSRSLAELAALTLRENLLRPVPVNRPDGSQSTVILRPAVGVVTSNDTPIRDASSVIELASRKAEEAERAEAHIVVAEVETDTASAKRDEIEQALQQALHGNELDVHFQPQIEISSGRCVAVEALIRWTRENGQRINPGLIASVCEERGMMGQLTQFVLNTSLRYAQFWRSGGVDICVGINLSAVTLADASFPDVVEQALGTWGVPGDRLTLELTESAIVSHESNAVAFMKRLKNLGCKLAIDDFGTGYSSFSYLRQFPLDELKIDQSFVRGMVGDRGDAQIVRALVDLAHTFDLHALAEGVESDEVLGALRDLGCDRAQGYRFSKALAPKDLPGFVEAFNRQSMLTRHPELRSRSDAVPSA